MLRDDRGENQHILAHRGGGLSQRVKPDFTWKRVYHVYSFAPQGAIETDTRSLSQVDDTTQAYTHLKSSQRLCELLWTRVYNLIELLGRTHTQTSSPTWLVGSGPLLYISKIVHAASITAFTGVDALTIKMMPEFLCLVSSCCVIVAAGQLLW